MTDASRKRDARRTNEDHDYGSATGKPGQAMSQHAMGMPTVIDGDPRLEAYYQDKARIRKNIVYIVLGNIGANIGLGVATTLSILHMKKCGVSESTFALMAAINFWVVSYLVMYFSWRSDHTVMKWGRRLPYTFLSMLFIVCTISLFPFFSNPASLILLFGVQYLFLDMKNSTWALIAIDCIPRHFLGRMNAINVMAGGACSFFASRYGLRMAESHEELVFIGCAVVIALGTAFAVMMIREPPIRYPAQTPFRPWSALQVGLKDRRIIVLMAGVAMISGFMVMWGTWGLLWITNGSGYGLGLSKADLGNASSWGTLAAMATAIPIGWIIDKVNGTRVVIVYWLLQMVTCAVIATCITSLEGIIAIYIVINSFGGLYTAADMMVWKSAEVKDMGSATSSNSFIRNMYMGCLMFAGGVVVSWNGKDAPAYINGLVFGAAMATIGMVMFIVHAALMRKSSLISSIEERRKEDKHNCKIAPPRPCPPHQNSPRSDLTNV